MTYAADRGKEGKDGLYSWTISTVKKTMTKKPSHNLATQTNRTEQLLLT